MRAVEGIVVSIPVGATVPPATLIPPYLYTPTL
jgi:hypothetical protein